MPYSPELNNGKLINLDLLRRKKINRVSANPTDPVSNTRRCYFLSVKMQNKKAKHQSSTKYLYFHKITGQALFLFFGEKKINKVFFFLPTDQVLFQHVNGNTAIFMPYLAECTSHL